MRKRTFIISLLLFFALFAFIYVRKEIFSQQAKKFIEKKLAETFQCQVSIGKIKPQFFSGLVLENLAINFPKVSDVSFNVNVDQALVDYSLWESFFLTERDIHRLRLISPVIGFAYSPEQETNPVFSEATQTKRIQFRRPLHTENGFHLGNFELILEDGKLLFGSAPPLFKNLHGKLVLNQKGLYFQQIKTSFKDNPPNKLRINMQASKDQLTRTAHLEHIKIKNFDILTNFTLSLNKSFNLQDKNPKIFGTLKTYGSVLNNRPLPELNSSFEIQDDKLRILTCSLGEEYDLRGIVSLQPSFHADLSLNFNQAVPNKLITQFTFPEEPDFSGLVNGLVKVSGELIHPKVGGYLEVSDGHLGDLDFVTADIHIKGDYPKVLIVDSRICREEDSFIMEGELDFSSLEKQGFLNIEVRADKGMLIQGWDITRKRENQVHMSKSIADDIKVTFDTFIDDSETYRNIYQNELGLEYRIFGNKLLKIRLKKNEEILGVEQRVKF